MNCGNPPTKPFSGPDEIILKPTSPYLSICKECGLGVRVSAMVEVAAILIGIFSVGIFLAHAVDAYHAQ